MKSLGRTPATNSTLAGTMLDTKLSGKTITINIDKFIKGGVMADENVHVTKCRLHPHFRQGLRRDAAGNRILTPMARAMDNLVDAALSGDAKRVYQATMGFYRVRNQQLVEELGKVARVRNAKSAMLVGVGDYRDDMFAGTNYLDGKISSLEPWEVGLSPRTMSKLGISSGDKVIVSRYPTTRVVVAQVREMRGASDNVVYMPVGKVSLAGEETCLADLLDGDLDGDSYVVRTVSGEVATTELADAFERFWEAVETLPLDRTTLTWQDHEERFEDPEKIAYSKALQKTAVGPLTLDFYAAASVLMDLKAAGVETSLTLEDLRQMMTDALELTFDMKHSNGANPMTLHALMLGMVRYQDVSESLQSQGLNVETVRKLAELLHGRSVRKLAEQNLAYAVAHGTPDCTTVARLIESANGSRDTLAEAFRDKIYPSLAG